MSFIDDKRIGDCMQQGELSSRELNTEWSIFPSIRKGDLKTTKTKEMLQAQVDHCVITVEITSSAYFTYFQLQ